MRAVLTRSRVEFGPDARDRYRSLLEQAFQDVTTNPDRPGVSNRSGVRPIYRFYPIRLSKGRVVGSDAVRDPRHVLVFRVDERAVTVVRIFHESMDVVAQLRALD